jgi:hypothetical protein
MEIYKSLKIKNLLNKRRAGTGKEVSKSYLKVYFYSGKCNLLGTEFCIYEKVGAVCHGGKKMGDVFPALSVGLGMQH